MTSFADATGEARSPLNGSEKQEEIIRLAAEFEQGVASTIQQLPPENLIDRNPDEHIGNNEHDKVGYLPTANGEMTLSNQNTIYVNGRLNAFAKRHTTLLWAHVRPEKIGDDLTYFIDLEEGKLSVLRAEGDSDLEEVTKPKEKAEIVRSAVAHMKDTAEAKAVEASKMRKKRAIFIGAMLAAHNTLLGYHR